MPWNESNHMNERIKSVARLLDGENQSLLSQEMQNHKPDRGEESFGAQNRQSQLLGDAKLGRLQRRSGFLSVERAG